MNDQRLRLLIWVCSAFLILSGCTDPKPPLVAAAYEDLPEVIDFNLHVRPILSDRCFSCHGPDNNNRKANLRLDLSEAAFAPLHQGDGKAIVPGKLAKSMAYQRLISDNPEMKMPPTESNLLVTPKEVAIIAKWIEQGAKYKDHWAFIPPVKAEVPKIENLSVEGNEIDDFILSRLNQLDLQPSEMVDRETLIRRVSFDLTGLAPSLEEVKQFVEDQSNDAYEQLVDNLLASEEYAERMAMEWMDVARYADSHGMHADGWRLMWPWRDWVINAFNSNMPYDQFVIEQLAGDLIPNATRDQKLATAFHRNHAMTAEGGVVDEEFRLEYVFDRTNTTAKAFMGLTMECARCHDHKFDPISQKEYFQMTSFFNNVKELGMTGDDGNYGPLLMLPSEEQEKLLKGINEELTVKWEALQLTKKELAEQVVQIKRMVPTSKAPTIASTIISFEDIRLSRDKEGKPYKYIDSNKQTRVHGDPELIKGKKGKAVHLKDEHQFVDIEHIGFIDVTDPYSAGAWIKQDTITRKTQTILGTAGNKNQFWRGWEFFLDTANYVAIQLTHSPPNNYIQVKSKTPVVLGKWTHVAFTYDGTGKAQGISIFVDGTKVPCVVQFDNLYKNIRTVADTKETETNRPIRIGHSHRAFTGDNGIFMGAVDEVYIFKGRLTAPEIRWLYKKTGGKADQLPALSQDEQLDHFITRISTSYPLHQAAYLQVLKRKFDLVDEIPEIMVMEDMPVSRISYVLDRGQYDSPLDPVEGGTPKHVMHFPENLPKNRLGLAKWLTSDKHPLTARVTVNRYWQMLFGKGLVTTPDDFGNQGELPTHPELLDWLSVSFIESGWDVKALLKTMVMSSTYKQQSIPTAEHLEKDPTNKWYARMTSYRLPAEMIRDNALLASGLLKKRYGGPSVKPYQPDGLWVEKGNFSQKLLTYQADKGDDLYRRSLYTFIRRTSPPPSMTAFDAPGRDYCTVQREQTNTPLQALVLMNDPQFVEAARVLAQRVQEKPNLEERIAFAHLLTTGRTPSTEETEILKETYKVALDKFSKKPKEALQLLEVGEYPLDDKLDKTVTAALTMVANTLMNHDSFYMKR